MHPVISTILQAFRNQGAQRYGLEDVTQTQHALQSAQLAAREGANATLITAALLHDLGHILSAAQWPHDCRQNLDDGHEGRGYEFLKNHFGPAVADPVRLHVAAKRYLCTADPEYVHRLSPTSLKSFYDQGGLMSPAEQSRFEAEPYFHDAVRLRHWDDAAKDPAAVTPTIEHFIDYMTASLPSS